MDVLERREPVESSWTGRCKACSSKLHVKLSDCTTNAERGDVVHTFTCPVCKVANFLAPSVFKHAPPGDGPGDLNTR